MKNIYEILKEFGLEIPEDKKTEFEKNWKENYRTKAEYDNAVTKRDEYKASLDTVNGKLKEFEGVDVNELKGQIANLQGELKKKDDEYTAKEADRVFHNTLEEAIKKAGGRNAKAVKALLDVDALKASKDLTSDIQKALDSAKESDAYLFGEDEPFLNPVGITGNGGTGGSNTNMASLRAAMGLPAEK